MVRSIITPLENRYVIILPDEYVGKAIEISYFAIDELEVKNEFKPPLKKYKGALKFTADKLTEFDNYLNGIRNEWENDIS